MPEKAAKFIGGDEEKLRQSFSIKATSRPKNWVKLYDSYSGAKLDAIDSAAWFLNQILFVLINFRESHKNQLIVF